MTPSEFENSMENLNPPRIAEVSEPGELKIAILNAERSAVIGVWFVVVPCFFLACVLMKYLFHIHLGILGTLEEMINSLDRHPGTRWIQPVMLIGLPMASIILNALAILHFKWKAASQSLVITLKVRWLNILLMVVSTLIVLLFLLYLIIENTHHQLTP